MRGHVEFSLEQKTASLSVGEFADFSLGPRESNGGPRGIWRAQLGTHWHLELRAQAATEHASAAAFEIPVSGRIFHRGWTLTLTGRIDQVIQADTGSTLREIKTVTRELPADEAELRRDYPEYFIQAASYAALARSGLLTPAAGSTLGLAETPAAGTGAVPAIRTELVFVETASGLAQTIPLGAIDETLFRQQLELVTEFLNQRLRARERLRHLRFQPAFVTPRPGQETTRAELTTLFERRPLILFEAPTGFGKTGVLLEFALGQLRSGHFDRAIYLTSKSTGQLQVVRTLQTMTQPDCQLIDDKRELPGGTTPVAVWHVRNKGEHCVNTTFHCVRDSCRYLAGAAERWPASGLSRFYLDEHHARDLEALRSAGRSALICPYEITRAALAFNDVWIGDYNYVFAPRNRGLFFEQPGFVAARTLLLIDEAHNLPSRVADAYSHAFTAADAFLVREELNRIRPLASLLTAWEHWAHALHQLRASGALDAAAEDDFRHLLQELAGAITSTPLDLAAIGPHAADLIWQIPAVAEDLNAARLPRLWWSPRDGELVLTCLDAAPAIGATLREFGGVVMASATLTPTESFAAACGLDRPAQSETRNPKPEIDVPDRLGSLTKRDTRKLYRQLTSAAELLRVEEERDAASPTLLQAHAPWREGAYDVAFDGRVDTTFQHRSHYYTTTAETIGALQAAASVGVGAAARSIAVFFPSYAYAEAIARELATVNPNARVALQPKLRDLAAQSAWVEQSLLAGDALFLVLGSSFAESIDLLGGRVSHAMIVGPALPEVNPVQRARLAQAAEAGLSRDEGFRRVYQVPGMTKVNQALGRLVRAPGQRAKVLLHCRRFLDPSYVSLLASEYRDGTHVATTADFTRWLGCGESV